eukprot:360310-Pleurochrysis_carterae.AAC.1
MHFRIPSIKSLRYVAMLRDKLSYAALALTPRNLKDIPPIAHAASGTGATQAALRAQVEHDIKIKQEAREALVRDYSNRIASILTTAMRRQGPDSSCASRRTRMRGDVSFNVRLRPDVQGAQGRA